MQRILYVFMRRTRGHPAPVWRPRSYRPAIDFRLADLDEGLIGEGRAPVDETPPARSAREIWER